MTITVAALLFLTFLLAGCEPASAILTPRNNANKLNKIVGIELKQATLAVNGEILIENLNLKDESFFIFYVFLKEGGLFIISVEPFSLAVEAGAHLSVDYGHRRGHDSDLHQFFHGRGIVNEVSSLEEETFFRKKLFRLLAKVSAAGLDIHKYRFVCHCSS